jgi:hypothetical protein
MLARLTQDDTNRSKKAADCMSGGVLFVGVSVSCMCMGQHKQKVSSHGRQN